MRKKIHPFTIISLLILTCFLLSCATNIKLKKYPKDYFIKELKSSDTEESIKKNLLSMQENERWNNCFDLTDEEFIRVIIPIYRECIDRAIERNLNNLPDFITAEEAEKLAYGIDTCAKIRFVVRNKDKFTLEKTPEVFDRCFEGYEKLIKSLNEYEAP